MKQTAIYLVLFFLVSACGENANIKQEQKTDVIFSSNNIVQQPKEKNDSASANKKESGNSGKIKAEKVFSVKKKNRQNVFQLYYSRGRRRTISLDSLIISDNTEKNIIQKIPFKKDYFILDYYEIFFNANEDINFDGYNDLSVINYIGMYNNSSSYWTYDKKEKLYKHQPKMDDIYNLVIDKKQKKLISEWHSGLEEFHYDTYGWKNGRFITIKKMEDSGPMIEYHPEWVKNENELIEKKDSVVDEIFVWVPQMPSFPEGQDSLLKFIEGNRKNPPSNVNIKVYLRFVVEKDGSIGKIEIQKGFSEPFDLNAEAKRVTKLLPKFIPGKNGEGKTVRCWYQLPITFTCGE